MDSCFYPAEGPFRAGRVPCKFKFDSDGISPWLISCEITALLSLFERWTYRPRSSPTRHPFVASAFCQ